MIKELMVFPSPWSSPAEGRGWVRNPLPQGERGLEYENYSWQSMGKVVVSDGERR